MWQEVTEMIEMSVSLVLRTLGSLFFRSRWPTARLKRRVQTPLVFRSWQLSSTRWWFHQIFDFHHILWNIEWLMTWEYLSTGWWNMPPKKHLAWNPQCFLHISSNQSLFNPNALMDAGRTRWWDHPEFFWVGEKIGESLFLLWIWRTKKNGCFGKDPNPQTSTKHSGGPGASGFELHHSFSVFLFWRIH